MIPLSGTFLVFKIKKYGIKKEIKNKLFDLASKDELVTFEFNQDEINSLNWKEKNEFELNGNMYDVLRKETKNNLVKLVCFLDEKESNLRLKFYSIVQNTLAKDPIANSTLELVNTFFKSLYFSKMENKSIDSFSIVDFLDKNNNIFPQIFLDIITPPPRAPFKHII